MKDIQELILTKLDRLDDELKEIRGVLAGQHGTLVEHVRRSEANEQNLDLLRTEFAPVKQHVVLVGVLGKGLVGAVGLTSTLLGIAKAVGWF